MRVLSLFDGMSCGRLALDRAGVKVETYYASEIDKHAIEVSSDNYPDIIQLGDINNWKEWDIDWSRIDLVIAGSPCQGFSAIGKQLNFNDPRSALFFEFINICNHVIDHNPKMKFFLENVNMKKDFINVINRYTGVGPIKINSKTLCAQSRTRLYWTNIITLDEVPSKTVKVSEILVSDPDEKYFLQGKRLESWLKNGEKRCKKRFSSIDADTAICMTARQYANWYGNHVTTGGRVRQLTPVECERLQTVPDDYTKKASDKERYRMLGNGWTVDVIAYFFKYLNK